MNKVHALTLRAKDSVEVTIGIEQAKRQKVAKSLSEFLASTYVLYIKSLYYHWNVTGPNFVGLHKVFEDQYNELHHAGDELAERVRALGHFTPGTVAEIVNLSSIKDDPSLPSSAQDMVQNLLDAHEACTKQARQVLSVAESVEDEVTVDLMVERMAVHEKAAWMLRSMLQ